MKTTKKNADKFFKRISIDSSIIKINSMLQTCDVRERESFRDHSVIKLAPFNRQTTNFVIRLLLFTHSYAERISEVLHQLNFLLIVIQTV